MFHLDVAQQIEREHLFSLKDKVLVALSGGADSVALLCVLLQLGYHCEAAHCNFHLREAESDRDEDFVRALCAEKNVICHVTHFDTISYASLHCISIEMAARELRYLWFEELRIQTGSHVIAVAHHRDDSVETLLLNLIRGTGINGLRGIRPKKGVIVRPLLSISKKEIVEYLDEQHVAFVTDSSNLHDEYTRNKIRLNLLPLMETINPSVKEGLFCTATHLNEAALIYNKVIEEGKRRVKQKDRISIPALLSELSPQALLFELLYPLGFNASQTDNIFRCLCGQAGRKFISPEWILIKDRDYLLLQANESKSISTSSEQELILDNNLTLTNETFIIFNSLAYTSAFNIPREKQWACLDADKLKLPLTIRKWRQGDYFIPFGMKGKKKISDYLTDKKYSLTDKAQVYVVCSGQDIVWLVNERSDDRFRVNEQTSHIILLEFKDKLKKTR